MHVTHIECLNLQKSGWYRGLSFVPLGAELFCCPPQQAVYGRIEYKTLASRKSEGVK